MRVAETDLRERVFEREVGDGTAHRTQEDAECDQQQRPPGRMREHASERPALGQTAGNRIGQRDADQERKAGLDGIVQGATGPLHMALVIGQQLQNQLPGKAAATRERRSTSAIISSMTKPR